MSDPFSTFYLPPEGTTGSATDYMGQVSTDQGAYNIGAQPQFTVPTTVSAAPAQDFSFGGYTPTFDFSPSTTPTLPSYGYAPEGYQAPQFTALGPTAFSGNLPYLARTSNFTVPASGAVPSIAPSAAGGVDVSSGSSPTQAAPSEQTPTTPAQGGGLSDILKSLGGLKGVTSIAGGLLGYLANQRAQQQAEDVGNQIKAAYQNAAQQTRELAQPYITAGTPQLSMALQGALSPAQLQQYQAQQARLAQAAARSGGIGAIQTAAAEQQFYQKALQDQQAMALQLLAPGNELMSQAINQELQGTTQGLSTTLQYQTMANEAAAKLFQNLGSMGASTPQSQTNAGVA